MADTRRELILARIKSNLDTIATATVYRSRVEPLARGEAPAIIVEPVSDQPSENFYDRLQWRLRVRVTVIVRDNNPDDKADEFTQLVHSKIMNDPTMNSYALDTDPDRVDFSLVEADVPLGVISMDYLIKYRTDRVDLTTS